MANRTTSLNIVPKRDALPIGAVATSLHKLTVEAVGTVRPAPIVGEIATSQKAPQAAAIGYVTIDEIILIVKKFRKSRTLLMAFIIRASRKENLSVKQLCERFDTKGVPTPSGTKTYATWRVFYENEPTECCKDIDKVAKRLEELKLP